MNTVLKRVSGRIIFISGDDIRDSIYQVSTRPTGKVNEENISTWLHMHSTQYSEVQYIITFSGASPCVGCCL